MTHPRQSADHHRTRRTSTVLVAVAVALLTVLGVADPAAAATRAEKLAVLAAWTSPPVDSYRAWEAARGDRDRWSAYRFDWAADGCSASPDIPLGFDFRLPCRRHDFGYRNYRAMGAFPANKARVDNAFHADLKRRCATYRAAVRPACLSLAWTYYQAVRVFGASAPFDRAALQRAGALKAAGERAELRRAGVLRATSGRVDRA